MSEYWVLEFKGARYDKFFNPQRVPLRPSEFAVVQAEKGEDMGRLLRVIYSDREYEKEEDVFNILRRAAPEDLNRYKENREKEKKALQECRNLVGARGLPMRLVDAEAQFDGSKIIFFFSAEKRVDFRELVRELAGIHKARIEMRQIGAREEARRLGGYGRCGLKQCCTTFIKDFRPISTQFARDQGLALNPQKITGNCGRLLCCLLYEQEDYARAMAQFPKVGSRFATERGEGEVIKLNFVKEFMSVRHMDGFEEKVSLLQFRKTKRCGDCDCGRKKEAS
ncbi:MAG TPA: regulatory iron-sulfur-containing complex subunit RicT [candidate division Zixibacteria bacterium]|nr:regulatory iron-sulfur-containing complex subunit RicT [candidate division Zixibacteria bacterium]